MADQIQPWNNLTNGAVPLRLDERSPDSYALGTAATGTGTGNITASWAEIASGKYPILFVDNGGGSFLIGTSNG